MDDSINVQQQDSTREEEMINSTSNWSTTTTNNANDADADGELFSFVPLPVCNRSLFIHSDTESDFESASESGSEFNDTASYTNCFYGDDQMNFVTNLFESREPNDDEVYYSNSNSNPFSNSVQEELGSGLGLIEGTVTGRRVVRLDSDSDSEEVDSISGGYDSGDSVEGMESDYPIFWDCDDQRAIGREEFDWENVDGRTDDREGLTSMINRIEEISVSSEISSDVEGMRAIEWEILLAINNLEHNFEFGNDMDGFADTLGEYETIVVGQIVESESFLKGSPPAAKSFVDSLPYVVLTMDGVRENSVVCAVCRDEISVGEEAAQLPCCHHYHGECIVPWLSIRNTCPVCRFELPTDDADYEQRKNRSGGSGLGFLNEDSQVTYIFELLP